MPTCLDPVWEAYETSRNAAKVVRRCMLPVTGVDRDRAFRNTRFHGQDNAACEQFLARAEADLADGVVLSLYARFEARLKAHVLAQAGLLRAAAVPDAAFGANLADLYEAACDGFKMDAVAKLFISAVGQQVVDQVATIRGYRHWLAHGRSWDAPPNVAPFLAYTALTQFLNAAGLP